MSIAEKLLLGLNTTVIGMGIVFLVLIVLSVIVGIIGNLFMAKSKGTPVAGPDLPPTAGIRSQADKSGVTAGEVTAVGADEETAAMIMAALSCHLDIPLGKLKIRSIKAL